MSTRPLVAALLVSLALPTLASAQSSDPFADGARVTLFTGGGFGGQTTVHAPSGSGAGGSGDLAPSPLVGLRYELPVHRFALLGGQFRTAFWQPTQVFTNARNPLLDFDATAKARYAFRVKNVVLEPYALVPFGLSVALWNDSNIAYLQSLGLGLDKTNLGWNVGGFAGVTLITQSGFGGMLELGAMHHAFYDKDTSGGRWSTTLTQFTLHAGVTYEF